MSLGSSSAPGERSWTWSREQQAWGTALCPAYRWFLYLVKAVLGVSNPRLPVTRTSPHPDQSTLEKTMTPASIRKLSEVKKRGHPTRAAHLALDRAFTSVPGTWVPGLGGRHPSTDEDRSAGWGRGGGEDTWWSFVLSPPVTPAGQ